jgi:hypothetical protein
LVPQIGLFDKVKPWIGFYVNAYYGFQISILLTLFEIFSFMKSLKSGPLNRNS